MRCLVDMGGVADVGLRLELAFVVSVIDISGSVEHSFKQEQYEDQEERYHLRRTKPIKRYSSCSKTLRFVFARDILPIYQSIDIHHHQHKENLCKEVLSRLDFLELVRYVGMLSSLSAIDVLLPTVHVLWKHFSIEVGDAIEESLGVVPGFLIPSTLIIYEYLLLHICKQVCSLVACSHIDVFVVQVLRIQLEAWIFVNVVVGLDVVPSTNFGQILLVEQQNHQEKDVGNDPVENSHVSWVARRSRELVDANHIINS